MPIHSPPPWLNARQRWSLVIRSLSCWKRLWICTGFRNASHTHNRQVDDVLAELIGARGKVLSRDHLLRTVWGYGNAGDGRVVDNLVYRLRSKIEDDPANPELLMTVRGFGYRMKA